MGRVRRSDHYSQQARRQGYPARSVYKLETIDRKVALLKPGQRVLDLGTAPGSWLLYAAKRVGQQGFVLGVDLQALSLSLPLQCRFVRGDVCGDTASWLPEQAPFDVVLSDMAPATSGHKDTDHYRSAALVQQACSLAVQHLRPGGALVAKLFDGSEFAEIRAQWRQCFTQVRVIRPPATRSESRELFLVGLNLKSP